MLDSLCPPALLYLGFSLTQIIIDIFKNMYNTAIMKFIVMIVFTIVLNIICDSGLTVVSWMLVFIPFILMTIITSILLFVFGLSPSKGNLNYSIDYPQDQKKLGVINKKDSTNNDDNANNEYDPVSSTTQAPEEFNNYNY